MKITAIITSRDPQNKSKLQTDIDELINSVFSPMVEDERVILAPNSVRIKQKQWVDVSYKTIRLDKSLILELATQKENRDSYMAIEFFWESITKTQLRKRINIQKGFDEPSHILCVRLYKPLGLFERNLRKMVYEIVTKVYGGDWYKRTLEDFVDHCNDHKTLSTIVKKNSEQDKVKVFEAALEEMTYSNLIVYLFGQTTLKPYSTFLEDDLSDENLKKLSKDEIVIKIQSNRPRSLWDRLFSEYDQLKDLPDDIKEIQSLRNKVMHAKTVSYSEYDNLKKLLLKWNPLIEAACLKNETKKYDSELNISAIYSLSNISMMVQNISKMIEATIPQIDIDSILATTKTIADSFGQCIDLYSSIDFSSLIAPFIALGDISPLSDDESKNDDSSDDDNSDENN